MFDKYIFIYNSQVKTNLKTYLTMNFAFIKLFLVYKQSKAPTIQVTYRDTKQPHRVSNSGNVLGIFTFIQNIIRAYRVYFGNKSTFGTSI